MNQKIKNASPKFYDGIQFLSTLEVNTYKLLKDAGFDFKYEPETFTLWEGFRPEKLGLVYGPKSKQKRIFTDKRKKQIDMTYTPDFKIVKGNNVIFMETKGFPNDSFPIKRKMFLGLLESKNDGNIYHYLEPVNKKQILECINLINEL